MARGALLVVEGLDRSGKTTQCSLLASALAARGHQVQCMRFPDRQSPTTGPVISAYLASLAPTAKPDDCDSERIMQLLFAANRREKQRSMAAALASGVTLVVDRYVHSAIAYGVALGIPAEWTACLDAGLLDPDAVLLLDQAVQGAEGRPGFGQERYETAQFQGRVRDAFASLVQQGCWHVLDAGRDVQAVHADVLEAALSTIAKCRLCPLSQIPCPQSVGTPSVLFK